MKKLLIAAAIIAALTTLATAAVTEMTKRDSAVTGFFYTETIATGATGSDVHIYPMGLDGTRITCTIIAGGNTGSFEFTTSSDAAVTAGTATWQTWPLGTVTGTQSDALTSQVTGLRGVSDAGEITVEILY
jgi:uncharacterized integral membrane protein